EAAAKAEWLTPELLEGGLSPVPSFDESFLPDAIRPWVKDVAERMVIPLDFAGICALVTLAGVTGRRAFVYPKALDKEWKESICLSGAVVAPSGATKTPAWKQFTNIVVERDMDWRKDYDSKMQQYERDVLERERSRSKSGQPEPEKPTCRRSIINDATPEAMHQAMMENAEGLLYY